MRTMKNRLSGQVFTSKLLKETIKLLRKKRVPRYIEMKQDYWNKMKLCFHPSVREGVSSWNGIPVMIDNNMKKDYKFVY